jgi:hypothetical protein
VDNTANLVHTLVLSHDGFSCPLRLAVRLPSAPAKELYCGQSSTINPVSMYMRSHLVEHTEQHVH